MMSLSATAARIKSEGEREELGAALPDLPRETDDCDRPANQGESNVGCLADLGRLCATMI
jgi:hypothetical protein